MAYVEINLDEFSDEELLEEVKARKLQTVQHFELISSFYDKYYSNKVTAEDVSEFLNKLFWEALGKIV